MSRARPPLFYGWVIVAASFALMMLCSGLGIYALSVYLHAFVASGHFSMEQVSLASGLFSASGGLVSVWVGRWLDRFDLRWLMSGGCLLMACALASIGWVNTVPALFAFYIVLGIGFSAAALLPATALVVRWFQDKRATAMSLAATGNSVGAIVVVPPVAFLVSSLGFAPAASWLALALLVLALPLIWGVVKPWPASMGLSALGNTGATQRAATPTISYEAARASRYFKRTCIAAALGMTAHVGGQIHLFNLLQDQRASTALAAGAIAIMATSSVLARFVYIRCIARLGNLGVLALLLVVQGLALIGLGSAQVTAVQLLCIVAYGSTLGSFITQQSLVISEAFGAAVYGRLYGLTRLWAMPGGLIGPTLMGWLHAGSGGYGLPYAAIGGLSLLGAGVLWGGNRIVIADAEPI